MGSSATSSPSTARPIRSERRAAQVPLPLPRCLDRPHLRAQAHDVDPGSEVGSRPRVQRRRAAGSVAHPRRPAVHEVDADRDDGGLLPMPIVRDSFELWPAKRREFIVDFTKYQDGSPTKKGDVIYLTNVMRMPDGRMWSNSQRFAAGPEVQDPDDEDRHRRRSTTPDNSLDPGRPMLRLPALPSNWQNMLDDRMIFELQRGSAGGEIEWLINGQPSTRQPSRRQLDQHCRQQTDGAATKKAASTCGRSATAVAAGCTRSTSTWRSTES